MNDDCDTDDYEPTDGEAFLGCLIVVLLLCGVALVVCGTYAACRWLVS